jgi:hypothetical protein
MNDNPIPNNLLPFGRKSREADSVLQSIEGADKQMLPEEAYRALPELTAALANVRKAQSVEEQYVRAA